MTPPRTVDAVVYAQVKAKFGTRYDSALTKRVQCVESIKVESITQSRTDAKAGCVVLTLTLRFPEKVFLPLQPAAVIVIPDNFVGLDMVEVEATDPTDMNAEQVAEYLAAQGRSFT
jgi:hypothetical protein